MFIFAISVLLFLSKSACGYHNSCECKAGQEYKLLLDGEEFSLFPYKSACAQNDLMVLSCDLAEAARIEAQYILEWTHETPDVMKEKHVTTGRRRYEKNWLPLRVKYETNKKFMVPPNDVEFVWHTHRLSPHAYEKDMKKVFNVSYFWHEFQGSPGLRKIMQAYTASIWNKNYPDEPYDYKQVRSTHADYEFNSQFDYDLADGLRRRRKGTPHLAPAAERIVKADRDFLDRAVLGYQMWINLSKKKLGGGLVPGRVYDIVWHSHQDCTQAYSKDMYTYMGELASHDDGDGAEGGEEGKKAHEAKMDVQRVSTWDKWVYAYGDKDLPMSVWFDAVRV